MVEILIKPVRGITRGGFDVELTGLDPTSTDCIAGTVITPSGSYAVEWDIDGMARDRSDDFNLVLNTMIADVLLLALKFSKMKDH